MEAEEAEVAEEVVAAVAAVVVMVMVEVAELVVVPPEATVSHVHSLTDRQEVAAERAAAARLCQTRTISHACERSLRLCCAVLTKLV